MKLKFTCRKCGGHHLEEVMAGVTVSSEVIEVHGYGDMEYNGQVNDGGEVQYYQCFGCGLRIKDKNGDIINDSLELSEYLKNAKRKK